MSNSNIPLWLDYIDNGVKLMMVSIFPLIVKLLSLSLTERALFPYRGIIVMIRADFQHGMESVSSFKMNAVTGNYWLIYAAAMVIIITLPCRLLFAVTELI